ncbi:MAG: YfhO family protein [Chloroflexia bacterium]
MSRLTRRELICAVLVCGLAATLFLGRAIGTGRVLSPSDFLYVYPPWQSVRPAGWPGPENSLLSDSTLQFEPWLAFAAARLHSGSLPLWNPDNMLGAPLLGNMQSAIFSPLNWPYFIWPAPETLVVRVWLHLVLGAIGAYVLARQVARVGPLPAAVASLTFAYGAFMVVWALHPHTAAVIWLPWIWWATARLMIAPGPRAVAVLGGFVALLVLAGHPETAFHTMLATGFFALFLVGLRRPWRPPAAVRDLALWGIAGLVGGAVASMQILPFLEYTGLSWFALVRSSLHITEPLVPVQYAWTLFSPDWFGDPVRGTYWATQINYNESNNYAGLVPLLLAPLAFAGRDRAQRALALFLLGLGALALLIVYQAPIVQSIIQMVPVLNVSQNQRLTFVAELVLGLLGALGLETLLRAGASGSRRLRVALACSCAGLLVIGVGVPWLAATTFFGVPVTAPAVQALWQQNLWRTGGLILAGTAIIAGVWHWGGQRAAAGFALLILLLAGDLWQAHGDYLPTTARQDYFPPTPTTTFLQAQPGLFRTVGVGWALLPHTNLLYGLASLAGYDSLEPRLFRDLAAELDPTRGMWAGVRPFHQVQSPLLNLLNVRYVLESGTDDPNNIVDVNPGVDPITTTAEIRGPVQAGQTFTATLDYLTAITVHGTTFGHTPAGTLVFHLQTAPGTADLVTQALPAATLVDNGDWTVRFPPLSGSRGRAFYFYFAAPDAPAGHAVGLWYNPHDSYAAGARMDGGRPARGDLVFQTTAYSDPAAPWFARVLDGGPAGTAVWENRRVLPRAWLAHRVEVGANPKAGRIRLADPGFDLRGTAMLEAALPVDLPAPEPPGTPDRVEMLSYAPEAVDIGTQSETPGLLVLSDEWFPGWEATVDGQPAPIRRADYGLRSVYVPAGAHQIAFRYRPSSFTLGAGISALALLILAGLWWSPPLIHRFRRSAGIVLGAEG